MAYEEFDLFHYLDLRSQVSIRWGAIQSSCLGGGIPQLALGIARELTGRRRNRVFAYDGCLALLNEGTDVPAAGEGG